MRVVRSASTSSSIRRGWRGALAVLLLSTVLALAGTTAVQAQGPARMELWIQDMGVAQPLRAEVAGYGWGLGSSLTVSVDGAPLHTVVANEQGAFLQPLTAVPAVGQDVAVSDGSVTKHVLVTDLEVTTFDVAANTLSGTKGASPEWGGLTVHLANMYPEDGVNAPLTYAATESPTWSVTLPHDEFDLMAGVGAMIRQDDPDGDTQGYHAQLPNPVIRLDSHGVSGNGWTPGSSVDVFLDDDVNDASAFPFRVTVPVDEVGYFQANDTQVMGALAPGPGWVAKVVGPIASRETPTVTKEIAFPSLDRATAGGNVVSGAVSGTVTGASVGAGSMVQGRATCPEGSTPNRITFALTGAYSLDFGAAVSPPYGWGDPCTETLFYYGTAIRDLDGDEFGSTWFVGGMFDETHPTITVDEMVYDGEGFGISGTGWDLTTLVIRQCELLDGTAIGDCDSSTALLKNTYPDANWPFGMARFEEMLTAKQVLDLDGGGTVDCGQAPGTCALVAEEVYRPEITTWAPLTYFVPTAVGLDVELAAKGTVSTVTGNATVGGTVSATEPTWVHLSGELRQRLGRTRVVVGGFDTWLEVAEPGVTVPWTAIAVPWTGQAFGAGFAELTVWADLGEDGYTEGDLDVVTVKLSAPRKR